jgi:hypothetical protein
MGPGWPVIRFRTRVNRLRLVPPTPELVRCAGTEPAGSYERAARHSGHLRVAIGSVFPMG